MHLHLRIHLIGEHFYIVDSESHFLDTRSEQRASSYQLRKPSRWTISDSTNCSSSIVSICPAPSSIGNLDGQHVRTDVLWPFGSMGEVCDTMPA
jgi:hypothetical protein